MDRIVSSSLYYIIFSDLIVSPFSYLILLTLENADIQEAEQAAPKVHSSPEKSVRPSEPVDYKTRLAEVQRALAEAGVDAGRFVSLVSESKNEDGTPVALSDEELCVRLESVNSQRKLGTVIEWCVEDCGLNRFFLIRVVWSISLVSSSFLANEYYDTFLDTIDEVDAANALSENQGNIDVVAQALYLDLQTPKQDGLARAIHERWDWSFSWRRFIYSSYSSSYRVWFDVELLME